MEDNELIASFQARVENWNKPLSLAEFEIPSFEEIKVPIDTAPPMANRYATGKGIPSKERYQKQEKIKGFLMKLLPLDKQLARDISDSWEKDLYENSRNLSAYMDGYNSKLRELKMNIDIQGSLPNL